jgi:hypothetical protein
MANEYTNKRFSKVTVGGVNFLPGDTKEVSDDVAKALEATTRGKTHPLRNPKNPVLVPGKADMPPPVPIKRIDSLESLDTQKALAQVKLCDDVGTLAQWHETEKRQMIQAAIEQRGRELGPKQG